MTSMDFTGAFESASLQSVKPHLVDGLPTLHSEFKSSFNPLDSLYDNTGLLINESAEHALQTAEQSLLQLSPLSLMDSIKQMLEGTIDSNGAKTLSLKDVSKYRINEAYRNRNINQHAGFAAEILSTHKENMQAALRKEGITTYRADDRPDMGYSKNDQYVDKIRVNENGEIVERIQTKFVGKDGADWVQKMMSKKCDKYFDETKVDKIECPRDFFDDAIEAIKSQKEKLNGQLENVTAKGKADVAEKIQQRIDKLNQLESMAEQSLVTKDEARTAVTHPLRTTGKLFTIENLKASSMEGLRSGAFAAGLTFVGSTVTHTREFLDGEINAEELASKIATETGAAGAIGGVTSFVSTAVANTLQTSSCNLIRSVGSSCLPAAIVSFGVESFDSISDFTQGIIGADELAYDLGHNAASVAGGALAGAKTGALVGTALGPVGTVGGTIVGGLIGTVVATGVYETAVEHAPEAAEGVGNFIQSSTNAVMDGITNQFPDQIDNARSAFNDFFSSNDIPIRA